MQFDDIDFVIIGAAKSATTWLQRRLQSDPAVYMPDPELHYFSREYDRGAEWYLSQFSDEGLGKTVGEKSNSYLYEPQAAERLHRDLPHVKLVAQLRNPVARAYSGYCMLYRRGEIGADIETHLDPAGNPDERLLASGNFASHLQAYIDLFGRDKLLITFFEGVADDPDGQIRQVRAHLGLPPLELEEDARQKVKDKTDPRIPPHMRKRLAWLKPIVRPLRGNPAFEAARGLFVRNSEYPPLTDDLRQRLNEYYAPSIEALEKMSGQSLVHWYGPSKRSGR